MHELNHQVEFSTLLIEIEEALEEWDSDDEQRENHKAATVANDITSAAAAAPSSKENEIKLASASDSVPSQLQAKQLKLRSLARVNYTQQNRFDEGEEIGDMSNGRISGGKDWRLSTSGRWIKVFAQGPHSLMSSKTLGSILKNPVKRYIEQRKFSSFLQRYADIFNQLNSRCNAFALKSQAVGEFVSVCFCVRSAMECWEPGDIETRRFSLQYV